MQVLLSSLLLCLSGYNLSARSLGDVAELDGAYNTLHYATFTSEKTAAPAGGLCLSSDFISDIDNMIR